MMAFKLKETQERPIKSPQYRMTSVFRCSVNTSTQMYTSHCLLVSVSVSVSVKAPAVMIFFVENDDNENFNETRMHSSRMRTVRCSGRRVCVSQHALGRGLSAWGVSARGSICLGGVCYTPLPPVD